MPGKHTTVRLNPALLRRVKAYARKHDLTMTAVMERAITAYLARPAAEAAGVVAPFTFATSGEGGLRAGVNLDDTSQLLDTMVGLE